MARTKSKSPTWTDVKTKIAHFDRAGLLDLLQDLYAANKENQIFFTPASLWAKQRQLPLTDYVRRKTEKCSGDDCGSCVSVVGPGFR